MKSQCPSYHEQLAPYDVKLLAPRRCWYNFTSVSSKPISRSDILSTSCSVTITVRTPQVSWWSHQMETFSVLVALCAGNPPGPGEFPTQRPVTQNFDVFFDLCLNKRLNKQSWGWWFESPSCSLWHHYNAIAIVHIVDVTVLGTFCNIQNFLNGEIRELNYRDPLPISDTIFLSPTCVSMAIRELCDKYINQHENAIFKTHIWATRQA